MLCKRSINPSDRCLDIGLDFKILFQWRNGTLEQVAIEQVTGYGDQAAETDPDEKQVASTHGAPGIRKIVRMRKPSDSIPDRPGFVTSSSY